VKFSTATNPTDPQTGIKVPVPSVAVSGSTLSGNLESFGVSWNNQEFNQGSPKPDGASPGNTTPVTGTYDAATGAYTLEWSSQIVGGPFNGFSAYWHLTGRFIAAGGASTQPAAAPTSGASSSSAAPTASAARGSSSGSAQTTTTTASGPLASAAGAVTTTTTAPAHRSSGTTRTVLASRTVVTNDGWNSPTWLVVLIGALALLGLIGLLWAERELRRSRALHDHSA
jgi:hypothetical protein